MDPVTQAQPANETSPQQEQNQTGELNGRDVIAYASAEAAEKAGCGINCCGLSLGCCV